MPPSYAIWLSPFDPPSPLDPSSPLPSAALARIIESINPSSATPHAHPHIPIKEFTTSDDPASLLSKLTTAVKNWKTSELAVRRQPHQPLPSAGPLFMISASFAPLVEPNPLYGPSFVVDGILFELSEVAQEGSRISIELEKTPLARNLYLAIDRALFSPPSSPPASFPSIPLYDTLEEERAKNVLDQLRRNGEVVETEEGCEVGGTGSFVARNVVLMEREGEEGGWREVGSVSLA